MRIEKAYFMREISKTTEINSSDSSVTNETNNYHGQGRLPLTAPRPKRAEINLFHFIVILKKKITFFTRCLFNFVISKESDQGI